MTSEGQQRVTPRRGAAVVLTVLLTAAAAFLVGSHVDVERPERPTATATPSATEESPTAVTITPAPGATGVEPIGAVLVSATDGKLGEVTLLNDRGRPVPGSMAPDGLSWRPAVPLGYSRTYSLTAAGEDGERTGRQQESTFTTVAPRAEAAVSLKVTSGDDLREGATYGVGIVVVAKFDRAIPDRAAAERTLTVDTQPHVEGSWYWLDDQTAHWRPQHYYAPSTAVTVNANVYGAAFGEGVYGARDQAVSFRIGDAHVSIADDHTKQIQVYDNGELVRTMLTSMGKGGTQIIGDTTLAFWTQSGVYTVLDKSDTLVMDSSTYGLPLDIGYKLSVSNAVRLTHNGIYLHQLDSTIWAQGNTNVSHGCLNLNADNARWFYEFSQPGDVVEVRNTGGDALSVWQNGDWTLPWETWRQGSALS